MTHTDQRSHTTWTNNTATLISESEEQARKHLYPWRVARVLFGRNHVQFLQRDDVIPVSSIVRDGGDGISDASAM